MALRLPPVGLHKAKALSREGHTGSVQKIKRIKKPDLPCFPEARSSPRQKRVLVFDYVTIKAQRSDLTRERARLAEFDELSIRSSAGIDSIRAARVIESRLASAPDFTGRCWNSRMATAN
jgi:hypothetical protein